MNLKKLTRDARTHGKYDLADDGGQDVHSAHDGRVVLDRLEVDREVVHGDEQHAHEEEHGAGRRPDDALPDHEERHHCLVAFAVLPEQEHNEGDAGPHEQANDGRTVPRVLVASPLKRQEEHNGSWSDEAEPLKV